MTYRFDPELATLAAAIPAANLADLSRARETLRIAAAELGRLPEHSPLDDGASRSHDLSITDDLVPANVDESEIKVRIYRPASIEKTLPAVLYMHGGGFVLGDLDTSHALISQISTLAGVVCVSVDYRLAPEHPFPAGLNDCYRALTWLVENANALGVDRHRVAVGGESAGACLAAALSLLARDRRGPTIAYQLLNIPVLDDRLTSRSMRTFTDTPVWNRESAWQSWSYYLPPTARRESSQQLRYAAPARARDLAGLPPAHITTCEFDPLRDEGLTYADRLIRAGVPVDLHHYAGTFHGSFLAPHAAVSRRMLASQVESLAAALASPPPGPDMTY
jgi:acetyl esterase